MARFIAFTEERGTSIDVNIEMVTTVVPLAGDETRGTALTLNFATGAENAAKVVRVSDKFADVRRQLMKAPFFADFQQLQGPRVIVNGANVASIAAIGTGPEAQTILIFNFASGEKRSARSIKVADHPDTVRAKLNR